jgi:hypothetical protein
MATQHVEALGDITAGDILCLYARQSGGPQGRLRLDALRTFLGTDNIDALPDAAAAASFDVRGSPRWPPDPGG